MARERKEEKATIPHDVSGDKAFKIMAETEAGRAVFAWLAQRCGWFQSSLTRKLDGEIASLSTEAKEAQRLIYQELRLKLPLELRHEIEKFAETPVAVADPKEERKR
jgi:hypothetical protein